MKINFAWSSGTESFDSNVHCREDEKIFHLEIRQKEGGFAFARVQIQNPGYGLLWRPERRYCMISFDKELAFRGRLIGMPSQFKGELIVMDFIAISDDAEEQRKRLCEAIFEHGPWDKLFYANAETKLSELLQAQTTLPYWCRRSGKLSLSDIFVGKHHLSLGGDFFRDSLDVTITQDPLTAVHVEMKAEWLQQGRGTCELGHHIKKACRGDYLSTLTGTSLERSWWSRDQRIGRTGYKVLESQLTKISLVDRKTYKKTSSEFWHFEEKPKKVKFPRSWYDLQLKVGWLYRQKRREMGRFTLQQNLQDISGAYKKEKTLTFHLASIVGRSQQWQPDHRYTKGFQVFYEGDVYRCLRMHIAGSAFSASKWQKLENYAHVDGQSLRPSFFLTDRGQQAIEHALEIAKSHLAASARCIVIRFMGDLKKLKGISTDHTVTLQDPRIPGGRVIGKVAGYRFIVDGETGEKIAQVSLSVSVGTGELITKPLGPLERYANDDVFEENMVASQDIYKTTKSQIHYVIDGQQSPQSGMLQLSGLTDRDMLQEVKIIFDADTQDSELLKEQYPNSMDMRQVLRAMPTDIQVKLRDLKTYDCLEHQVNINVLTTWSAPKQINLSASSNQ